MDQSAPFPDQPGSVRTVGILGAGRVGTAVARQALPGGYAVALGTAKPPEDIELIVSFTAPGAVAKTAEDVIAGADLVILAIPLSHYRDLARHDFGGRIVIDAMNYWPPVDGTMAEFEGEESSSEVVQRLLPDARIVRALNHIGYHELEENALPPGAAGRQALALAGDDPAARAAVAEFLDRLGYDPVDAGPLRAARFFGAGFPLFGTRLDRAEMTAALHALRPAVAAGA
ncbi:MAG: NAD(P)-binding domain-containing protein [Bauldia sp.]|nr:NAD(P)-binding domain-containing protein [Bauldia sp.]MCW5718814.1 NAD(P)-binding domain-containing protein [Bauldia sp.]